MADRYYSNADQGQRFQPGTTAEAGQVDQKFDEVTAGFQGVATDTDRALKLPAEADTSQALTETALERRNKVVGFDKDGKLQLQSGFTWRGDWAASTEYFINDILVEPATGDWYRVTLRHTSGATFSAVNLTLALNVATLNQLKAAAESARDLSLQYRDESRTARNASQSAQGLSETARDKSQAWAETPEDTAVELGAYSSLHHKVKSQQAQALSESARDASQTARDASQAAQAASESARDLSQQYRNESQTARDASQTARTGSETARDKSQAWAETAVDVAVETGKYSSLHHAAKAGDSASAAATSETNAASSASSASTSASNAATSESGAATSATNAATSASAASTSETNAAGSATAAAASYDSFDDRYLGAKASDPTTDNDGDPLLTGALYFNSTTSKMREWNGSAWQASYATVDLKGAMNGDVSGEDLYRITRLLGPSAPQDAATKAYVDSSIVVNEAPTDGKIYARSNGGWVAPSAFPENNVIGVALRQTGGPGGLFDHIDIGGNTITTPTASWFNGHPVFGGMQDVTVDGQVMVEVPKFYYKRGTAGGDAAWWVSDQPLAGFAVMPAFVLDGVEVASFQYGKYQASESGGKLQSIPGVLPKVSTSLTDFLSLATARNVGGAEGFRLHHYDMWLAVQWLYLVEMATMDSQTATGEGRVNESSAANVDAADVAQATYRGIVGLWGNVYQWMDGVRTLSDVIERRPYNGSWATTGEAIPGGGGTQYPITFRATGDEQFIANTYSTANDSTATLPDYRRWRNIGEYYPLVGGYWSNATGAGLWFMNCGNTTSSFSAALSARLSRIVQ